MKRNKKQKNTSSDKNAAEETKPQRQKTSKSNPERPSKSEATELGKPGQGNDRKGMGDNPKPNTKKQCRKSSKQKITTKIKTKTAGKSQLTPCIQNSLDDLIGDCHFELGEDGAGDVGVLVGVPANHFFFAEWCFGVRLMCEGVGFETDAICLRRVMWLVWLWLWSEWCCCWDG